MSKENGMFLFFKVLHEFIVALVVADSWEDADADPVKELMEKVEKVKLLQRQEEKKEAYFEKVKAEESINPTPKIKTEEGLGPCVEEPKRVFLRRPKDGFSNENVIEASPPAATSSENHQAPRGRSHQKSHQQEPKQPAQTYEERQAAYQAARNRILGSEYKPDNQEIKEIKFIDRSKSPETLKMTQQNMVEHYGEELSRELMHQPEMPPADVILLPDFSQPPPCISQQNGMFNAPPGFQQRQTNFQQSFPQNTQFMDGQYYMQNEQMQVPYSSQFQGNQYMPQDPSSVPQNNFMDGHNEQTFYYAPPPPTPQQMAYMQRNMAYPPPNFQSQGQSNQHMMNQMPHPQMLQQQQQSQASGQIPNQFQMKNGAGRGYNGSMGQNRQPIMYPVTTGAPINVPNGPYMPQCPPNSVQNYSNRNESYGGQRQMQQNGQFAQSPSNMNNGRRQPNKQAKSGQNTSQKSNPAHQQVGQNPVPFGCPPRQVNAIREQQAGNMPPNTGAGLLGAHPMTTNQWPTLSQTRPQ
ncbi:hypothetical protein B9Z55_005523 [Caenorhabditis nigoni]|uniref:SUZ domain-containing protein n=2 Tax=Caenorhabditis nigoni TaxID=1611254 RepID=A0A2G5V1N0_9PELO|nr:hypothetical protein B9Z55_005523 [Caenorhabditis nigoni]